MGRRLASAALLLSASLILSRVLGVLRNVLIADVFGNTRTAEAYFAAFRIPDTMFTLVSGGALASAFIPIFAGLVETRRHAQAWRLASSVFNAVCLTLAVLALIAFVLAPQLMQLLAGGFTQHQLDVTVQLTRIMLLQPIFLGGAAIISAVLQTYNRFVLTAIAPVFYNLSVVVGALAGKQYGVHALAWSVVIGAALQVIIQVPGLWGERREFFRKVLDWKSTATRQVLRLFLPRLVGYSAFQLMLFITLYLASRLPPGSVGAINYAWLLIYFPVGVLGTAAATAIFPTLSRLTAAQELPAVRQTVNRTLRLVLFLAMPCAVGLIVLRRPIIDLLYHHGDFSNRAVEQTAFALIFYAVALVPLSAIEVLPRPFYAMRDTITPVRIAVVAVVIDAVLSVVFVHVLPRASGQGGLALATAIATTIQAWWLTRALDRRLGGIDMAHLAQSIRNSFLASLAMGIFLYVTLAGITAFIPQSGGGVLFTVAFEVALGGGVFFVYANLLGAPELFQLRSFLRPRK